jgi:ABC-type amino acid transport substrate-binding protein
MSRYLAVLGLALAATLAAAPATAQPADTLATIRQSQSIRLGYVPAGAPFAFRDRDGKPAGYSVDLCSRVAAGIGRELGIPNLATTWVPVEPTDRLAAVKSGRIDIECGLTTSSLTRMKEVDFSLPIFIDSGTVLVKSGATPVRLTDLAGKKVAVLAGTTTLERLKEVSVKQFLNLEIVEVKERLDGLARLRAGEVAGFAGDRANLVALALASGVPETLQIVPDDFSYEPLALVVRRNDADFRLAVNRVLAGLYRSGEILAVFDRTFGRFGKPTPVLTGMYLMNALPE